MAYNITNPESATFTNYVNTRDFSNDIAGDVSPEGLCFVPSDKSPVGKSMLLAANEVSGSIALFAINSSVKVDTVKPELIVSSEIISTGEVGKEITLPTASALDDYLGAVTLTLTVRDEAGNLVTVENNKFIPSKGGNYTVSYTAVDASGNITQKSYTIAVPKVTSTDNEVNTINLNVTGNTASNPKTGDASNMPVVGVMMFLSAAGIVGIGKKLKSKQTV